MTLTLMVQTKYKYTTNVSPTPGRSTQDHEHLQENLQSCISQMLSYYRVASQEPTETQNTPKPSWSGIRRGKQEIELLKSLKKLLYAPIAQAVGKLLQIV